MASATITLGVERPSTAVTAIASRTGGNAISASFIRISGLSSRVKYPESAPRSAFSTTTDVPIISESRAPWATRASALRPKLSVPNRNSAPGGTKRVRMESLVGSASLIIGTNTAASTRTAKSARPVSKERCRRSRCAVSQRARAPSPKRSPGAIASIAPALSGIVVPHARIEPGIGNIHGDVDADHEQRHEQERALDHGIVAIEDRGGQQLPDAGHREYRLGDHRARD